MSLCPANDRSAPRWSRVSHRGQNVGRFKPACRTFGCQLPVIVGTSQPLMSFSSSTLCRVYAVGGWLCLDWRTLLTACTDATTETEHADISLTGAYATTDDDAVMAPAADPRTALNPYLRVAADLHGRRQPQE
jgi:hypothetical protein